MAATPRTGKTDLPALRHPGLSWAGEVGKAGSIFVDRMFHPQFDGRHSGFSGGCCPGPRVLRGLPEHAECPPRLHGHGASIPRPPVCAVFSSSHVVSTNAPGSVLDFEASSREAPGNLGVPPALAGATDVPWPDSDLHPQLRRNGVKAPGAVFDDPCLLALTARAWHAFLPSTIGRS